MDSSNLVLTVRPLHRIPALAAIATRRKRRSYTTWKDRIIQTLNDGDATTRMLARKLGCQSSDISTAMLALRRAGLIVEAAIGLDPHSHHKARFWSLADAEIAELFGEVI